MKTNKVLSIIIPTYNMEALLSQCLDSLLVKEGKEKLDVLVVNDGSKDRSSEIAHRYADKYPETFRVIDKENGNYGSCINAALPLIQGKYVKILDADDSYETKNLEEFLFFLESSHVDLVLSDYIDIDPEGRTLKRHEYKLPTKKTITFSDIDYHTFMAMHSVTYNVKVFENLNYHQTEGISFTDMEWVMIPMTNVHTATYYPIIIYRYLVGRDGQTIGDDVRLKRISHTAKGVMNELEFFNTLNNNNMAYPYFDNLLKGRITGVYMSYLNTKCNKFDLEDFDTQLRKYDYYYKYADTIVLKSKIVEIEIVKLWRKVRSKSKLWLFPKYCLFRVSHFVERKIKS